MQVIRDLASLTSAYHYAVVVLGNLDGLHKGHQAVLAQAKQLAKNYNAPLMVYSFHPHPREYFTPSLKPLTIYPLHTKITLLKKLGVDALYLQRFNASFAALTAQDFIERMMVQGLHVKAIVTGENFAFGKGKEGNTQLLSAAAKTFGFQYESVPLQHQGQHIVSSTVIRNYLKQGNIAQVSELLGRPYAISGHVVHGDKRGRSIGFPTANVSLRYQLSPAYGVYAARVRVDGIAHKAVANIGIRPTFESATPLAEIHIFELDKNLYGKRLQVELVEYIREEQKFINLEALKNQIEEDCAKAKIILQ